VTHTPASNQYLAEHCRNQTSN